MTAKNTESTEKPVIPPLPPAPASAPTPTEITCAAIAKILRRGLIDGRLLEYAELEQALIQMSDTDRRSLIEDIIVLQGADWPNDQTERRLGSAETNEMTWRAEPPTAEGFYWLRRKGDKRGVWVANVEWCPRTDRLHALTTGGGDNQEFDQYEWAGPLQPPLNSPNTEAEARRDQDL